MRLVNAASVAMVVLFSIACAGKRAASSACAPLPPESAVAGGISVYRDCEVDRPAVEPQPLPRLQFTSAMRGRSGCIRAVIDMVVDTAGRPIHETARLVRTTDAPFAEAVMSGLSLLRYQPAMKNGQAVQQLVRHERTMSFVTVVVPAGSPSLPPRPNRGSVPRC